mgnify:CR=1 FL=1
MKIVFFTDDFPPNSFGGAGIVAFEQARALMERGHTVYVVTTVEDSSKSGKSMYEGLTVYSVHTAYFERFRAYQSLYNPKVVKVVKELLAEIRPDVVHAHNIHQKFSYATLAIAKRYSKKVFLTAHDVMLFHYSKLYPKIEGVASGLQKFNYHVSWYKNAFHFRLQWNPLRNILIKFYIRNLDGIFSVSSALADALNQNGFKNITVLHNGIDAGRFTTSADEVDIFRSKHNLEGKKILFFSGRLSKAKGAEVILRALVEVSKKITNVCFLFAGKKDSYVDSFLLQAENLGLKDRIVFLGWIDRDAVKKAYGVCDVVPVLSVYLDPFPTTNLEAMAAQKPVIGTCFGGTPEVVVGGETGYIVNPNNSKEVTEKILELLLDEKLAESFGKAGLSRVSQLFSLSKQIDVLCNHYADSK